MLWSTWLGRTSRALSEPMEDAAVSIEGPETNGLCSKGAIVFGPSGEYGEGNAAELSSAATGCTANGS